MAERRLPQVAAIEAALRDLAVHIDHPQTADLSVVVLARLTAAPAPPRSRRPRVALAAAALLMVVLLAWPAPRHAVADWLGIGAVRVVRTGDIPAGTGSVLRLGREVSLEEASDRAPFTILGPATMEAPSAIYMGEPSADSVTLLWGEGPDVPGDASTGVGVLLTEMPGSTNRELIEKRLGPGTTFETTTVGEAPAYWIAGGQHELLYVDPYGRTRPDTTRLAANTLLWEQDGVTFRLESRLSRDAAIELAGDLEPVR